jgi:HlyD family secretion protein
MDPKPKTPRIAIVAVAVVVLVAAGAAWWHHHREQETDPNRLDLNGNVDIRQVSLAFNASERIVELGPREGDTVAAGQVIGRLDTRTPQLKLQQADAQAEVAAQALKRLRAGSRPQEIAQAQAEVAAAQADVDQAATQAARLRQVGAATSGQGISQQDLDNALSRQKAAVARRDAAQQAARLVTTGPRQEDIAQAQAQLDAAHAERALLARQIEESSLKAPVAAVVRSRLLEPGEMASPQRPVYTLAIVQPKWVRVYVDEPHLPRVKPGLAATVTADGLPGVSLPGRVGYVSSVAEFTPKTVETAELRTSLVYEVRVMVDDPHDQLRLGMPATAHLQLAPLGASDGASDGAAAASAPH